MKILTIDTSNYPLSIGLLEGENVIGEWMSNVKKNHSIRLMPAIESLMSECNVHPKELSKIVVAYGPGSYTGVRIGVTVAKTLAWSLNIPVVGISSLAVLAGGCRHFNGLICPIFDARRGQVFTGLYKYEDNHLITVKEDENILLTEWLDSLKLHNEQILFVGNDVEMHQETIQSYLGEQAVFATSILNNPRSGELGILGLKEAPTNYHELVPNYLRMAEAEVNWLAEQKKEQ